MITRLHIKNYALIKELNLELGDKLNIITGETGAGKSIMLGALGLLLGNRSDSKALEYSEGKCVIEGHFNIKDLNLQSFFNELDLDFEEHSILRREISLTGKSRAFVNDSPVTINVLKDLGERLVDIHSQHSNVQLKSDSFKRDFIDFLAQTKNEIDAYRQAFFIWKTSKKQLDELKQKESQLRLNADFNKFQFTEIEELKLVDNEYESNEHELELLNNSERISEAFSLISTLLDDSESAVLDRLSEMRNATEKLVHLDARLKEVNNRINSTYIELRDLANEINGLRDEWTLDEERLSYLNERQEKIQRLLRKHNVADISNLLELSAAFRLEFEQAENFENEITTLEKKVAAQWNLLIEKGKILSNKRKETAAKVGPIVVQSLRQLGIPNANFEVNIISNSLWVNEKSGIDKFEFQFSANKGVELQDLSKVASGGEISRIMLALKALMSESNKFPTLIFDEIDLGISGEVAIKMGAMMKQLSQKHQLVCITHLPQIAAMGQKHYKVQKVNDNEKSYSTLREIKEEERINEIGQMIGGIEAGVSAMNSAKELLQKFAPIF